MTDVTVDQRSAFLAYQMLFPTRYPSDPAELASGQDPVFDRLSAFVAAVWAELSPEARRRLRGIRHDLSNPVAHNTPAVQRYLLELLAEPMLAEIWSRARVEGPLPDHDPPDEETQKAAIRVDARGAGLRRPSGGACLDCRDDPATTSAPGPAQTPTPDREEKDNTVMTDTNSAVLDIEIDRPGTPRQLPRKRYLRAIKRLFDDRDVDTSLETAQAHAAYVTGALIRDSFFDPASPGFEDAFIEQWNEGYEIAETTETDPSRPSFFTSRNGLRLRNLEVYLQVYKELLVIKAQQTPTVQELAAVSDEVLARGPVDDNLPGQGALGFRRLRRSDAVVRHPRPAADRHRGELPGRLRATEHPRLLDDRRRVAPGSGRPVLGGRPERPGLERRRAAGRRRSRPALRRLRLGGRPAARPRRPAHPVPTDQRARRLPAEVLLGGLGARAGPVPQRVPGRVPAGPALAAATGRLGPQDRPRPARVRLAARLGLYPVRRPADRQPHPGMRGDHRAPGGAEGVRRRPLPGRWWNGSSRCRPAGRPTSARSSPWPAPARRSSTCWRSRRLDIAANRVSTPLFPTRDFSRNGTPRAVFSVNEYQLLLGHVENWLAANSITDHQRFDAAQPREVQAVGSLPAPGGFSPPDANALRDQLMQMVGAGQIPSADQLNQMFQRPS